VSESCRPGPCGQRIRWYDWQEGESINRWSHALFDGALVVFNNLQPAASLCGRAGQIVESLFGPGDPRLAEKRMSPDRFRQALRQARKAVQSDRIMDHYWHEILAAIGYPPGELFLDRMRLRVVPSRCEYYDRFGRPLPAHRDSWGSGILSQINWWLPIYPLTSPGTMVIWPGAFQLPVRNTCSEWDYNKLLADKNKKYPLLPVALEVPRTAAEPVLIEPGCLLAFSAAHLHAGGTGLPGITRFSLDSRTVWIGDIRTNRAAANVDGDRLRQNWNMFPIPASKSAETRERPA